MLAKDFEPFALEALLSRWEHSVEFNYSESGVHPMTLAELVGEGEAREELFATLLNYPEVNGERLLRDRIAALYKGAGADNVLVTVGAIEANFATFMSLLAPGDRIALMHPNYPQIAGLAANSGIEVRRFALDAARGWALDRQTLADAVDQRTRLVAVCNPNNPTGKILTEDEMDAIVRAAERVGAWILADEVYAGAEREREAVTPSFYGRTDKVLAVGGLSKAYGLPGLRVGWVVGPPPAIEAVWRRHDYVAISGTMLGQRLAAIALDPAQRPRILARTRGLIRAGFPELEAFVARHGNVLGLVSPDASAMALVGYDLEIGSNALVDRLRREQSVLVAPGDAFGLGRYLRISFALPGAYLRAGFARIGEVIDELRG